MRTTTNLTCCEKAYIKGLYEGGMKGPQIAIKVKRSEAAIYKIVTAKIADENSGPSVTQGRPKKLNERDVRAVVRYATKNRRATLGEITQNVPTDVSPKTIRRTLHQEEIYSRIARLKPFLLPRHIANRRLFALEHLSWTMDDWKDVIWTDESTFELGRNSRQLKVWRKANEEYNSECTGSTFKSGRSSVMVWGAIALGKKSELVIMDRSKRTATDFVDQVYDGSLLQFMDGFVNPILMEDGAPVHRSNAPKHWREQMNLKKMVWPAQSPDMNPIENLWMQMKDKVSRKHAASMTVAELTKNIKDAWTEITIEDIDTLIMSMPARVNELVKQRGGSTRW